MEKDEKEFLEKLQRDIDYRYQKLKEQNGDLQNKIVFLQGRIWELTDELKSSKISIWRSIWKLIPRRK